MIDLPTIEFHRIEPDPESGARRLQLVIEQGQYSHQFTLLEEEVEDYRDDWLPMVLGMVARELLDRNLARAAARQS